MTGGVLPEGFDLVVPQEACQIKSDRVLIPAGQQQGQHVRMPGEDLACGDVVVEAGIRLNAIHIGLMASLGLAAASVRGPLRVALLSTGDELLDPTQPGAQAQGKRFDSNRFLLRALLVKWPSIALHDVGIVADQPQSLEQILCALGEEHDLILSSGGVSAGEADFTRGIMERLGQLAFCKVAMRPGRPLAMGRLGRALYLGLPGNPVAAAMTFWYFVAPAHRIEKKAGRSEFQRASIAVDAESTVWLSVNPNQGSGILSSLSKSSVIAVLEHDRSTIEAGDSLRYVCIDDLL
ncbi:MAG: molybdopterin molybdenumtransferase MoeA [Betaproteobacteria bacterium]|nr:molybdopterin molybdenumtransferase MoeA [Betaproteobacteria bacterium]